MEGETSSIWFNCGEYVDKYLIISFCHTNFFCNITMMKFGIVDHYYTSIKCLIVLIKLLPKKSVIIVELIANWQIS